MAKTEERPSGRQLWRWLGLSLGLAPLIFGSIVAFFWVQDNVPRWVYWKIGLIILIAAETVYITALAVAIPGTLVTGALLMRNRRQHRPTLTMARWFLLGAATVMALLLGEAAGAVWRRPSHATVVDGGPGNHDGPDLLTRIPMPSIDVKLPTRFPDPPGDRDLDVVVVGESSAEGVPYQNWLSIGQILKWQLGEILPDRPVRLEILAKSGEDLEQQHERLARLERRPELLIIYCGHNEFQARFQGMRDLRYYFDEQQPGMLEVVVKGLERASPLCGLIHEASEKCRIAIPPSADSSRRLVDVPAFTRMEHEVLIEQFHRRLNSITTYAQRIGAIPVLIVPPANDAGFEPNRSYLPADTPRAQREALAHEFQAIGDSEAGDLQNDIDRYQAILARYPQFAEAHYRLAQLLSAAGEWDGAFTHFAAARDHDGYPTRAPSAFQQAYRDVARRCGCILIDGEAIFHAIGTHGMLDDSLFHDAMHPSLRGYIALSQAVLQELQAAQAFGWPRSVPAPIIDPARCVAHFRVGQDTWRHLCHWSLGFYGLMAPLRYDPSMRHFQAERYRQAMEQMDAGADAASLGIPNLGIPQPVPSLPASVVNSALAP